MPAVDVAMAKSLRRGFLDLFVASLRPALQRRGLTDQISDVGEAFSSWDNCMQVDYCKWPVIALIIIGGLIIISVVWCIIRCLCCGLSCCCSCFSCLKCCGNCCGCCDPPRGSRRKYLDEPYIPPDQGYKSQEPMHAFGARSVPPPAPQAAKVPEFAQYAEFDAGGKKNEDSLPQMPSWEGAEHKKVLVEEEAVEMNALKKPEAGGQAVGAAAVGAAVGATSPTGARSPVNRSPYGPPGAGPGTDGFFAASAMGNDPYAQGAPAYNQPGMAYSEPEQGYGMAVGAMGAGRQSPHPYNNNSNGYNDAYNSNGGYGQARDYPGATRQGSYDNYGATRQQPYDNNYDNYNSQAGAGYGIARHQTPHEMDSTPYMSDARRSPAPQAGPYGPDARRSPAPQGNQFASAYGPDRRGSPGPQAPFASGYGPERRGSPGPQAPFASGYGPERRGSPGPQAPFASGYGPERRGSPGPRNSPGPHNSPYRAPRAPRAPPQRQYSSSTTGGMSPPPVSNSNGPTPLRNEAGFDFTSGYSRPPTAGGPTSPGGYRQPGSPVGEMPGQSGSNGAAYPGYKPYQPAS